jgi:hypothetical protein
VLAQSLDLQDGDENAGDVEDVGVERASCFNEVRLRWDYRDHKQQASSVR